MLKPFARRDSVEKSGNPYIQPHERADGTHQPLRLSQPKPIRRAQRQACLDSQIRVSPLATP